MVPFPNATAAKTANVYPSLYSSLCFFGRFGQGLFCGCSLHWGWRAGAHRIALMLFPPEQLLSRQRKSAGCNVPHTSAAPAPAQLPEKPPLTGTLAGKKNSGMPKKQFWHSCLCFALLEQKTSLVFVREPCKILSCVKSAHFYGTCDITKARRPISELKHICRCYAMLGNTDTPETRVKHL